MKGKKNTAALKTKKKATNRQKAVRSAVVQALDDTNKTSQEEKALLKQKRKAAETARELINTVNSRMHNDALPRAPDFNLPYNGGEYIQSDAQASTGIGKIQAKEHRNAMQVLPHLLHDIDDDLCHLAAR